jgi:hypothetical protein
MKDCDGHKEVTTTGYAKSQQLANVLNLIAFRNFLVV